jgi:Mg-chelatase subunit ChlD
VPLASNWFGGLPLYGGAAAKLPSAKPEKVLRGTAPGHPLSTKQGLAHMQHDFILLDRSGSMESLWSEALASINGYVKKLADDKVDTGVTLAVFDGQGGELDFQIVRDRIIPWTWKAVDGDDASPRGMTPLSDAVGEIVALANRGNYDKVAIIVMTDGQENASKKLSVAQAKALLDACRAKNWQVIFLGADFDNATQAASYGNAAAATVRSSKANLAEAMSVTAAKRASYAASGKSIGFTEDEKRRLKE